MKPPKLATGIVASASSPAVESPRLTLADGAETTVQVARFDRREFGLRVVSIDPCATLLSWCAANGAEHAIVGGFYVRPGGPPLGDVWIDGEALAVEPFDQPWHLERACVHADGAELAIRARRELGEPRGHLLQAGPKLVGGRRTLVRAGRDPEGFSAGARQFDSDITDGRYPRAALGFSATEIIAVACEGRADDEAGLTMAELATAMQGLGAVDAINLDGGGSASLVVAGALLNTPRAEHGREVAGGREIVTALHFFAL
ncbi:MAG: phosphodiester glycosidase family protein [Actinobacteria bacterium]|nr:phosphodiester glycosidase family protein [Actinomycetota bacterium]